MMIMIGMTHGNIIPSFVHQGFFSDYLPQLLGWAIEGGLSIQKGRMGVMIQGVVANLGHGASKICELRKHPQNFAVYYFGRRRF